MNPSSIGMPQRTEATGSRPVMMGTSESGATTTPARPFELPELLFIAAFLPIAAFSWVGILLAELGAFSGWRVLVGGTVVSAIAVAAAMRDHLGSGARVVGVSRRTWISLVLVAGVSAGLFGRPGEYLIEGADASIYLAIGRNIERTGRIITADPLIEVMPEELRASFFPRDRRSPRLEGRLPGGLRIGPDDRVIPGFFHLLPVWIAITSAAAGPYAPYYLNVFLAVLGVGLAWLIGRRVWSPVAGGVAAVLLAFNFGQIFHAGLPSSEMLAQVLVLSGIFFTVLAWDQSSRVSGACAGMAIGLAAFTRIDTLLLMVPLGVGWLVLARQRAHEQAWRWYAATLAIVAGHAILHATTIAWVYTKGLFADGWWVVAALVRELDSATLLALILVLVVAGLIVIRLRERWLIGLGAAALLILGIVSPGVVVTAGRLLSPLGLVVALAGLGLVLTRGASVRVLPVVLPFVASAMLLLAWHETTTLPHDFRRAVPVILPGAMLLVGAFVAGVSRLRSWLGRAVWLVPLGLSVVFLQDSWSILRRPLAQGIHAQVAEIAARIPPDALVLTDKSIPGHVAAALQYTFDRPALRLSARPTGEADLARLISRAVASGRQVFAAIAPFALDRPDSLWRSDFAAFALHEESVVPLHYEVLLPVRGAFPREHRVDQLSVALYRIDARGTESRAALPLMVDIGGDDFSFLIQGFHAAESSESVSVRWTTGDSRLALPRLASPPAGSLALVFRFSAFRPPNRPPPAVRIAIDGLPVGVINDTTSDQREHRLLLPTAIADRMMSGPTMLSITSDTFVPRDTSSSTDGRKLGILLDWVRIE